MVNTMEIGMPQAPKLDHVVVGVVDLDKARQTFTDLGFVLSPRMTHPFGTGNSLITFGDTYLELIAVVDEDNLYGIGCEVKTLIEAREGCARYAVASDNVEVLQAALDNAGLNTSAITQFERDVPVSETKNLIAKVSVFDFEQKETPYAHMFFCQQHRPEAIWIPEWCDHPNGALNIRAMTIVSNDPRKYFYSTFFEVFGKECVQSEADVVSVKTSTAVIEVLTPQRFQNDYGISLNNQSGFAHYVAAIKIAVEDLTVLKRYVDNANLGGVVLSNGSLLVPAEKTNNLFIEFFQQV